MSSTSPSKSICNLSSRLWKSWYVTLSASLITNTEIRTDSSRSQRCHARRLRAPASDQPVRQGPACGLPDSQPQERQSAPQERWAQVQGQGCGGCRLRSLAEELAAEEGVDAVCMVVVWCGLQQCFDFNESVSPGSTLSQVLKY
jgi:hypothetical protein